MQLAFNLLGILVVFGICWLLSWQRKSINWKLIGKAFVIQLLLAVFIVKVPLGQQVISGRFCQCQQHGYLHRWYWCIVS